MKISKIIASALLVAFTVAPCLASDIEAKQSLEEEILALRTQRALILEGRNLDNPEVQAQLNAIDAQIIEIDRGLLSNMKAKFAKNKKAAIIAGVAGGALILVGLFVAGRWLWSAYNEKTKLEDVKIELIEEAISIEEQSDAIQAVAETLEDRLQVETAQIAEVILVAEQARQDIEAVNAPPEQVAAFQAAVEQLQLQVDATNEEREVIAQDIAVITEVNEEVKKVKEKRFGKFFKKLFKKKAKAEPAVEPIVE